MNDLGTIFDDQDVRRMAETGVVPERLRRNPAADAVLVAWAIVEAQRYTF